MPLPPSAFPAPADEKLADGDCNERDAIEQRAPLDSDLSDLTKSRAGASSRDGGLQELPIGSNDRQSLLSDTGPGSCERAGRD